MPLRQGCSAKTCRKNLEQLRKEGYDWRQAYAITFDTARRNIQKCCYKRKLEIKRGKLL